MSRPAVLSIRSLCVVLALVLGMQVLQPRLAGAQPVISLTKSACTFTPGGGCGTNVSASPGDVVRYVIAYNNVGTGTAMTISDILQSPAGESYVTGSCLVPSGTGATCGASSGSPNTISFAFPSVAAGTSGSVSFSVSINPGFSGLIQNYATAGYNSVTFGTSNLTTVSVGGSPTPPPTGTVSVSKTVRDYTAGGPYGTNIAVNPTDSLQYSITVTNISLPATTTFTVTDALQPGQVFVTGSCAPITCTQSGNTIAFVIPGFNPGSSQTVSFVTNVLTNGVYSGLVIPNTASVGFNNTGLVNSNTTTATVSGAPTPAPCSTTNCTYNYCNGWYYPGYCPTSNPVYPPFCGSVPGCNNGYPYCYGFGCPTYPAYPTYPSCAGPAPTCGAFGAITICGLVSVYNPASGYGPGQITVSGETLGIAPGAVVTGSPFSGPGSYCLTLTVNSAGQATSIVVASNLVGSNYVCGTVSQFTPGYQPYSGFSPYPGYTAYPGYGPYSGYGPYAIPTGNWAGWYGWGGPLMVSGYPFQVSSSAYFPYSISYGNPYCFLLGAGGTVNASLSVVPTLATPVDDSGQSYWLGHERVW